MLIPTQVSGVVGRGTLVLKKHAPVILTVTGLASMTAGAVLGAKQTLKFEETLTRCELRMESALKVETDPNASAADLRKAALMNVLDFTKLYGPAASLFVSGVIAVGVGHGLLHKRNVELVAAANAIEKSFQAYRDRVIKEYGEDKDRDYMLGMEEVATVDENGKKTKVVEVDPTKMNQFSRIFDEGNTYWQGEDPSYNQFFLNAEQRMINDILIRRGHVFLNEVYDRLGFPRIPEGNVMGWIVTSDGPNYIDFGMFDASSDTKRNFVNGFEKNIWLNFNVQPAEILSQIGK